MLVVDKMVEGVTEAVGTVTTFDGANRNLSMKPSAADVDELVVVVTADCQ